MQSIKFVLLFLGFFAFHSCGFDRLQDDIVADFNILNCTDSLVNVSMRYYSKSSSENLSNIELTINSGDTVALFSGLQWNTRDSLDDEEIFSSVIVGEVRKESCLEVTDNNGKVLAVWTPNDENGLFYQYPSWSFKEQKINGKIYKYWMFDISNDTINIH